MNKLSRTNTSQLRTSQSTRDLRPHVLNGRVRLDRLHQTLLSVVVDDGSGLVVVLVQTLLEDLGVVILSLDQRLARHVVLALHLRRVEHDVVGTTARRMHSSSGNTLHQLLVGNVESQNSVDLHAVLRQHLVELPVILPLHRSPSQPEEWYEGNRPE